MCAICEGTVWRQRERNTGAFMRNLRLLTLGCAVVLTPYVSTAVAQESQDKAEQNVRITEQPKVTDSSDTSVTLNWTTNNVSANNVRYRLVSGGDWKTAPPSAGSKDHS